MKNATRHPVVHSHLPAACREAGVTQRDLCRAVGIRFGTWRALLQGRHFVSIELAEAIAEILGIPVAAVPREIRRPPIRPRVVAPKASKGVA